MPILIMALLALMVFGAMGLLLFYAAYKEAHTPHPGRELPGKPPAR